MPIQILPELLPATYDETASVLNLELPQEPVTLAAEAEEFAQHYAEELSQETVLPSCEELPQNVVLRRSAPYEVNESLAQETAPSSVEEQASLSTATNPSLMQPLDDEYGYLNSNRKRTIKRFGTLRNGTKL